MIKILFYINTISNGGAERVIVNLANSFSEKDYEVVLVTSHYSSNEYPLKSKVKRLTLEKTNLKQSFIKKNITRVYRLRKICKQERPDIVVSFMAEANFRAIIATMFLGIKTLISVRNDPNKEYSKKIYRLLAKLLYPFASGLVFQTEEAKKWFSKRIQKKSKVILNHVDEKFYQTNYTGRRKNIVTVGRLEPQKNHKLLIEAFAGIANDFPNENLVIYGEGSQKEILMNLVKRHDLEGRVFFMGTSMEIHEKIKDAKIFVLSSDYEGLPNVVMEAMTLGLPVISTNCPIGGPKMLIENNRNGILVSVGNVGELANAMRTLLSDPSFAEYLGKNAKLTSKKFEPNKVFKIWEDYISFIISMK